MFGVHWARKDRSETHFSSHVFNHQGSVRVEHCLGSACSKRTSPCPPHLTTPGEKVAGSGLHVCLTDAVYQRSVSSWRSTEWEHGPSTISSHAQPSSVRTVGSGQRQRQSTAFSVSPPDLHVTLTLLHSQIYCSLVFLPTLIRQLLEIYMLIVSMQIRPNLHFKLQGVTLSSSMDIFFPSHLMCL